MAKSEGPRCVLTLPLLTEPWQEHILEKRFKIMEHLYNSLVSFELKKLRRVQQMPEYDRFLMQQAVGECRRVPLVHPVTAIV